MQEFLEAPVVEAATSEPPDTIIDVPIRTNLRARNVVLGLMAFMPFVMLLTWFISMIMPSISLPFRQPAFNGGLAGLFGALFMIGALKVRGAWFKAKLRRELRHNPPHSVPSVLRTVLPETTSFMSQLIQSTARQLAELGIKGVTIRGCEPRHAIAIEPLTVTIEPLPLDESLPTIARIASGNTDDIAHERGEANKNETNDPLLRTIKRSITLAGGKTLLIVCGVAWVFLAVASIVEWRINLGFLFLSGFFLLAIVAPFGRGAMMSSQQWLIVPGGLIGRRANYRGGWNVHLFDPRESVLAVHRIWFSQWFVSVADRESHQSAIITPTEVNALLRAWLSPLPPPPREQLTELAG
jgi:hypothetical protein